MYHGKLNLIYEQVVKIMHLRLYRRTLNISSDYQELLQRFTPVHSQLGNYISGCPCLLAARLKEKTAGRKIEGVIDDGRLMLYTLEAEI